MAIAKCKEKSYWYCVNKCKDRPCFLLYDNLLTRLLKKNDGIICLWKMKFKYNELYFLAQSYRRMKMAGLPVVRLQVFSHSHMIKHIKPVGYKCVYCLESKRKEVLEMIKKEFPKVFSKKKRDITRTIMDGQI